MSSFKKFVESDLNVFLNLNEFADIHIVNGQQMPVVLDKDELKRRQAIQAKVEYSYKGDLLFYVEGAVYGDSPAIGEIITYDGEKYRVSDFQEDAGLYLIALVANLS